MALWCDVDFEAGNLSELTMVDAESDITASAAAALAGTNYGMELLVDNTTAMYGYILTGSSKLDGGDQESSKYDPTNGFGYSFFKFFDTFG